MNQVPTIASSDMELLTVEDLALILKLSKRTIWRMKSSGKLPAAVPVGRAIRWRRADVKDWINQGCPEAFNCDNRSRR